MGLQSRSGADQAGPPAGATGTRIVSPIQTYLERLHAACAGPNDGRVATYIPELAKADPSAFGICIATTDGFVYEVGDSRQQFTIQSISKPFVYGIALEDRGRAAVRDKIGVEPTGDAFNSISLAPGTGCPLNPMINAGAIAATSLVAGYSPEDRLQRLLAVLAAYAGRPLSIDRAVYESERDTGHRNRAIGHMLRNFDILTADPEPALDLYFQQCSVAVDCRDLSLMAATLANGGVNPQTGERAVRDDLVESILSVMTTCGMYDYAGEWVYSVGMPAKSGVAGGVLAVLPGQLGIAVFSPPLDARGNSVRGVAVCQRLSRDFGLHSLRVPRPARSTIRAQYTLTSIGSKRLRSERERALLDAHGGRARVYELQGDLAFPSLEAIGRAIVDASRDLELAIVDFKRVSRIDDCAAGIFVQLILALGASGKRALLVNVGHHARFLRSIEEGLSGADEWGRLLTFPDLDRALEWCEDRLIAERSPPGAVTGTLTLAEHDLCQGLAPDALARLETLLERRRFAAGALIMRMGEPADEVYLLMAGRVSVTVDLPNGQVRRLSTLSPGMAFGELALVDRLARTADVRADDTAADCYAFPAAAFDRLGEREPAIRMRILENMLRGAYRMVSRLNQEISTLAS